MNNPEQTDAPQAADLAQWSCYTTQPAESLELFDTLRAKCPVAFSHAHDGFFVPLTYDATLEVNRANDVYSPAPQVMRPILPRPPIPALEMDPPQHAIWRAVYNLAVNGRTPKLMEDFVRHEAAKRIEGFVERGSCDIVQELSVTVPALAICQLLGIDDEQAALKIQKASNALFAAQGDAAEYGRVTEVFAGIVLGEIFARREAPRGDFLSDLATMDVDGQPLTEADYIILLGAFLGAGHHSTTSAMTSVIYEIYSNQSLHERLVSEPEKIPAAIEEALRLHPPFFGFFRRARVETTLAGVAIPAQTDVYMNFAGANRDPAVFKCPAQVDIDRPGLRRHLTFGAGIHSCPGAPLARMELRVVIEELFKRVPDLRLDTQPDYAFDAGEFEHIPSLPVSFKARAREAVEPLAHGD